MTEKQKNLITRTITGVLFVAVLVGCLMRPESMVLLFALITGRPIWEYGGLVNHWDDIQVNRFICTLAGVYFFLAVAGYSIGMVNGTCFIPYLITVLYLILSELFTKAPNPINNWAYAMFSQMYIALPFSTINILAFQTSAQGQYNMLLPLSVFVFLWVNDTGAYCAGSLFGRHKLFPRVSPGKTWEGCIGGAVLVMLAAALIGYMTSGDNSLSIPVWMGLGLVVVVFGTLGDLVESLFKRTLGIKDSGNILPGHGGMLDRFDSSLMAIPASVVYIYTISLL